MAGGRGAIDVVDDVLPERWLSQDVGQPRFRAVGSVLVVKQSRFGLVFGVVLVAIGPVMAVGGATGGDALMAVVGVVAVAGGVAHLVIDTHTRLFLDRDGWHWQDRWRWRPRLVLWSDIDGIVLRRHPVPKTMFGRGGARPAQDVLVTRSGQRIALARMLPEPNLKHFELSAGSVDLFCHMQHDLAHRLGVRPAPIRVDLGDGGPTVGFVHPCPICDGTAPVA